MGEPAFIEELIAASSSAARSDRVERYEQLMIHAIAGWRSVSKVAFDFPFHSMNPTLQTKSGAVRIVDARNFPLTTISMAHVTVKPGGMRELPWHLTGQ